jgi:hypothetical protein
VVACALALLCGAGGAGTASAQQGSEAPRRTTRIGIASEVQDPRIDGSLDDKCWEQAVEIGELVTVEPVEGAVPPRRTRIRLLQTADSLCIAIECDDESPAGLRASQRRRDADLEPDDRIELLLDPFENRRTGYFFQVGAGGSIGDALVTSNGNRFDKPVDFVWEGRSLATDRGWQAEIAIPFRSIPHRDNGFAWAFNIRRIVRATNEEYRWACARQSVPFFRISELGTVEGLQRVEHAATVDVVPYVAGSIKRTDDETRFDPDSGADAFWRITPELTLAATAFTDFAETEVDERQINLDRFPLFFPEKRDFFLDGSSYFTFGTGQSNGPGAFLPFFSRRIGLDSDGSTIPLYGGVKLTGEAGPWELGVLDVVTEEPDGNEGSGVNLAAARIRHALAPQTSVGMVATSGRPLEDGQNTVGGVDFYHRVPQWVGDLDLQLFANATASWTSGSGTEEGEGSSSALEARSRGREWEIRAGTRHTTRAFDPELGFVPRTDTRSWWFAPNWKPRAGAGGRVRNLDIEPFVEWYQTESGEPQQLVYGFNPVGLDWHAGDKAGFVLRRRFDRVEQDFTVFDGSVTIAAGDYWVTRGGFEALTSQGRPLSAEASVTTGGYFDGTSTEVESSADWRASGLLEFGAGWSTALVDLPEDRDFTTQIGSLRCDVNFSPDVSWRNLVQFDNASDELALQSRLRWITAPGSDLFVVGTAGWERTEDGSLLPGDRRLELKLAHRLQF